MTSVISPAAGRNSLNTCSVVSHFQSSAVSSAVVAHQVVLILLSIYWPAKEWEAWIACCKSEILLPEWLTEADSRPVANKTYVGLLLTDSRTLAESAVNKSEGFQSGNRRYWELNFRLVALKRTVHMSRQYNSSYSWQFNFIWTCI